MLAIQKFLRETPNGVERLQNELALRVYEHPELPIVGFKYNQIDSPKTHPVVREARGIVLERDTWNLVAKGFNRFFNAGEVADEYTAFNWDCFTATEKVDGSLILLYWYGDQWHVNTSGSFGLGEVPFSGKTWRELFWETSKINSVLLNEACTYVFELCTVWNKVVRTYPKPTVFLLSVFVDELECSQEILYRHAEWLKVKQPERYSFSGEVALYEFLSDKQRDDPTFEGVVIRDNTGLRYKCKTTTYVAYHHLKDNGNVASPKNIIPLVLAGETDEVLSVFPELRSQFERVSETLEKTYASLLAVWRENHTVVDQKEFALAVKHHPFSGILFNLKKKYGVEQTEQLLREAWLSVEPDKLADKLFPTKVV